LWGKFQLRLNASPVVSSVHPCSGECSGSCSEWNRAQVTLPAVQQIYVDRHVKSNRTYCRESGRLEGKPDTPLPSHPIPVDYSLGKLVEHLVFATAVTKFSAVARIHGPVLNLPTRIPSLVETFKSIYEDLINFPQAQDFCRDRATGGGGGGRYIYLTFSTRLTAYIILQSQ
jgi:hypothetical protein